MNITTKFNLGQKVYPIHSYQEEVVTACPMCEGHGKIVVNGIQGRCPECYGGGSKTTFAPKSWKVIDEWVSKVGKVTVELHAKRYQESNEDRIRYMLGSTGVGSGTLWNEDDLFATRKEAQAECEQRNE